MGYARYGQYLVDNRFRFATFARRHHVRTGLRLLALGAGHRPYRRRDVPSQRRSVRLAVLVRAGAGCEASRLHGGRVLWAMAGSSLLFQLFQRDWGIDTFGPVHAFELALPILCLTIVGTRNLNELRTGASKDFNRPWVFCAHCSRR